MALRMRISTLLPWDTAVLVELKDLPEIAQWKKVDNGN